MARLPIKLSNLKAPTDLELRAIYNAKYSGKSDLGWGPRARLLFSHFSPDEHYEALVEKIVSTGCSWIDIGCGRDIFPSNPGLARKLSERAAYVFGVDPDENILENPFLTESYNGPLESCPTGRKFDVITMRMVAEHIENPDAVARRALLLANNGAVVVIITPNKWSPMPILTRLTSLKVHHFFKRILWETEERDTFPVQFKLNTRSDMRRCFEAAGFSEIHFQYLDDCRTFNRFRILNFLELSLWKILNTVRIRYPENCLLAAFRKT